ncbi:hypothetical protein AcW1_004198 [Taiwanofungus camphoratus]|nr:hypothetical protein AcW2_006787 [Antrodia cinnamomea]KAI0939059.1 hypothetical protein AcV5_000579 [Antrodia cinnamomea]KAI0951976.1 hypothetical protein AcV7_007919 [Antrodia cinnamomea]KAI0959349.1 hypothetical protein AcW1_004198 [Antrodia cinnamomea]
MSEHSASPAPGNTPGTLSFLDTVLTPGSSLNPTFLLLVDSAFAALLFVLCALAIVTRGNVHLIALMAIEVALWGSVKWFVYELQKVEAQEPASGNTLSSEKPVDQSTSARLKEE